MKGDNARPRGVHHELVRSASVISFATLISRILGFIRDLVIARLFGIYLYAQAFVVAFKIPNLFRDLVGEGAANAAFVPVFTEYKQKHSKEEFWELANVTLNLLLVILSLITLLGIVAAPLLVRCIAPGFTADPEKLATTIKLCRIIFPYVMLVSLAAFATGVLNSLKHFSIPAFAPCLLNVSIIVSAMLFGEGVRGLALGVLIGGVLQLFVQIPILYKKGYRPKLFKRFIHPAVTLMGKLMVPRLLSSSIYQLNNFVDTIFGSLVIVVGEGGVAALYFAYRLILFPLGICSTALAQAILPTLSQQAVDKDHAGFQRACSFGIRITGFIMWPVTFVFIVLAGQIIATLFEGGKFDAYSTRTTAQVLVFYSIGLFAYGSSKILQSCFFALKDTRTPAKVAGIALALNILFNAILIFPLKISGIALATSLSGMISFLILFFVLKKKIVLVDARVLYVSLTKTFLASSATGLICYFISRVDMFSQARIIRLLLMFLIAGVSYVFFCFLLKSRELKELASFIKRK